MQSPSVEAIDTARAAVCGTKLTLTVFFDRTGLVRRTALILPSAHGLKYPPPPKSFCPPVTDPMKPLPYFALLIFLAALASLTDSACAQEPIHGSVKRGGLTDGLISRTQLRSLINRAPNHDNPLRQPAPPRAQPNLLPTPTPPLTPPQRIHDPQVAPMTWQQEVTAEERAEADDVDSNSDFQPAETSKEAAAPFMGPLPSPDLESQRETMGMLVDFSIEQLVLEIGHRRSRLDASLGIDDQLKNVRLKHLESAELASQKATQYISQRNSLQNQIANFDKELDRLRKQTRTVLEPPETDANISTDQLQIQLRNLQAELDHEKTGLRKVQDRIGQRDKRMSVIPAERLKSRNQVNDFHEQLLKKQVSGTSEIEELLSIRAQELLSSTKVQLLDDEAHWHDLSREKLPLQKSIHQRNIQRLEKIINDWNHQIAERKQSELELQIQMARQAAFETHPALREFSLETSRLAQSRVDLAEVSRQLQNEKLNIEKQQHGIQQQLQDLEKHEEAFKNGGDSESNQTLIEAHRKLILPWETMARIGQLKRELLLNRGTKLALREQLDEVADPQQFIRQRLSITHDEPVANTTLIAMAEESIDNHRQQLLALVGEHEKVHSLINDIKSRREETLKNIESTRKLIDAYALWVRDAAPVNVDLLNESRLGAAEFFATDQWKKLGRSVVANVEQRPWRPTVGLLGLLTTFAIGRRFKG